METSSTTMVAPPATSRLTRRLVVMPKLAPHMLVRFDQAKWCGRELRSSSSRCGRSAVMSLSIYGSRKMMAMAYAVPAMIAVLIVGSRRAGPVRREAAVPAAMSACLLSVPVVDPQVDEHNHDDQAEVHDRHRGRFPDEALLQVVHVHRGRVGLVARTTARHLPEIGRAHV